MGNDGRYFWMGKVKVEVKGQNIERFFNIAAQRGIFVGDVSVCMRGQTDGQNADRTTGHAAEHMDEHTVMFWTTPKDFKTMKAVARKCNVRLRIRKRTGLPFFLYRNRMRKLLAAGVMACFLLLYGMSFFIWDISFEGNQRFTDETLLHYMSEISVVNGMRKSNLDCEALEASIRNQFTEIIWVSAEIRGTRLSLKIKENEALLAPMVKEDSPCDLAAAKDGVIVRTVVRNGFSQVKAGDEVTVGDLLVDGTIPIYDDSETLVNSHEIHADAEIYAKTVHTFQKWVPTTQTIRSRTGRTRKGLHLELLGQKFYLLSPGFGDLTWEIVTERTQLCLFENFYLPVYLGQITAYEYTPYEKNYTELEISFILDSYLKEYKENLMEKGVQILGSNGKIEHSESGWKLQGTMTVVEDIAKEVPTPEYKEEIQQ